MGADRAGRCDSTDESPLWCGQVCGPRPLSVPLFYLVPGFILVDGGEDLASTYETIITTVTEFTDVEAKPFSSSLGGHTRGLELVGAGADERSGSPCR